MHDASRGVIIITCRGTMSLEDCLSDATCADIALSDFDPQLAGRAQSPAGMALIAFNTTRLVLPHLDTTSEPIVCASATGRGRRGGPTPRLVPH